MTAGRRLLEVLRRGRGAWIVLLGAGLLLAGASAASAYWTITATISSASTAVAAAGTLSAPTAATAVDLGGGAVAVSWNLPASQLAGATYRVTRTSGLGSPVLACSAAANTASCTDTTVIPGTSYAYSVVAVLGTSWQSAPATTSVTTLGVTTSTLPSGTVGTAYSTTPVVVGSIGSTTWSVSAGALPGWATFNASTGTISGMPTAGTTSGLQLTVTDSTGRTATSVALTLTIAKADQTISFSPLPPTSAVAGSTTWTPAATATSGLAVTFTISAGSPTVCTISASGVVSFTGTGSCVVDANQPGDASWNAAPTKQATISVTLAPQTISFTALATITAGTPYTLTATASSGLAVVYTVDGSSTAACSITGLTVSFTKIGTCVINADQPGNAIYAPAPRVQRSINVTQGTQLITFDIPTDASIGQGPGTGAGYTPVATASPGITPIVLTVAGSSSGICSMSGGFVSFLNVGTCTLVATQAGSDDFAPATATRSFVISSPAGLGLLNVTGTGTSVPVLSCSAPSANRTCTISGVDFSGSATFDVVVVNASGTRAVFSYTAANTVTETGQNTGTATIVAGTSITGTTLTASHVGNAPKTSVLTFGTYKLTITVVT